MNLTATQETAVAKFVTSSEERQWRRSERIENALYNLRNPAEREAAWFWHAVLHSLGYYD